MFENILLPYSVIRIDTLLCYSGLLCWAHLQMCHPTPLYGPILLVILRNVPPYSVISHSAVNWNFRVVPDRSLALNWPTKYIICTHLHQNYVWSPHISYKTYQWLPTHRYKSKFHLNNEIPTLEEIYKAAGHFILQMNDEFRPTMAVYCVTWNLGSCDMLQKHFIFPLYKTGHWGHGWFQACTQPMRDIVTK